MIEVALLCNLLIPCNKTHTYDMISLQTQLTRSSFKCLVLPQCTWGHTDIKLCVTYL